jgi:hypothetical protein
MHTRDQARSIKLLLNYKDAADALGLTEQALRDLVWKNRGPVVTEIGRRRLFAFSDLEDFVARHRRPPAPPDSSSEAFPRRRRARLPRDNQNVTAAALSVRQEKPDEEKG